MAKRRSTSVALVMAALLSVGLATGAGASEYTPATPEPGTDIPEVDVTFGMRPYADNTFYVIGMEKGWYKDVGINIKPEPYGLKTTENQWISILLNRQVDINSATCSMLLPSYRTTDQLKCLGLSVTFYGQAMLADPKLGLKPVSHYIEKEGLSFEEALKKALTPLVGETIYVPASIAAKEFIETPFRLAGLELPNYTTMEDSQMLLLAKSGRIGFMHPNGAPIAQTMLDAGWIPIYDSGQLLQFGPGGIDSPLEPLVSNNGFAATADWINENQTTVLRFSSVMFRIFDALKKDPSLYAVYTPYLNSVAGTSLDADGVRRTVENLDPFVPFEDQTKYFEEKDHAEYYENSMGALIKSLEASGAIPTGVTPVELIWAAPIYDELKSYKAKTEKLFEEAEAASLSDEKKALIDEAKKYYAWFDFLDSYRLASAAMND